MPDTPHTPEPLDDTCPICAGAMLWDECDCCLGKGVVPVYDPDPLDDAAQNTFACFECGGKGRLHHCPVLPHTLAQVQAFEARRAAVTDMPVDKESPC